MSDPEKIFTRFSSLSSGEQEQMLAELDDMGFFMLPDESRESFIERFSRLLQALRELEKGNIPPPLQKNHQYWKKIPERSAAEANDILNGHYRFRNTWVPLFYSSKETGLFSAGVQFEVDETYPLIFLHGAFDGKSTYAGYDRGETIAHELIHAARMFFPPSKYEEYFTCHICRFPLRRWMGNFFRSKYLITLFMAGFLSGTIFLSLGSLWSIGCFLLPLAILLYELYLHRELARARKKLLELGLEPLPVLLRLTDREIFALGKISVGEGMALAQTSLRWKIFFKKFRL